MACYSHMGDEFIIRKKIMTPKRKQVQDYILKYVGEVVSGNENVELYKTLFDSMNDKEFDNFMVRLKNGDIHLSVVIPNDGKIRVSFENNVSVGKKIGLKFFERVKTTGQQDYPDYLTPNEMLVMMLPIRKAQQLLSKKISIPEHNLSIDTLTGQVAGKSKSGKITFPEQQTMLAMNMKDSVLELAKIRGGDQGAAKALNDKLFQDGVASQAEVNQYSTSVTSTNTLKQYFLGMHIRSTL